MTNNPSQPSCLPQDVFAALWKAHKDEAVQAIRQEQHIGLKEAEEMVNA